MYDSSDFSAGDRWEFERWAQQQMCLNSPCEHPFCPEDSEVDLWEGDNFELQR